MDFLSNYIKLVFKFCSFPSICFALVFLMIDCISSAVSGADPFRRFRINSVPKALGQEKSAFTGNTFTADEVDKEKEIERALYLKTKNSLRRK